MRHNAVLLSRIIDVLDVTREISSVLSKLLLWLFCSIFRKWRAQHGRPVLPQISLSKLVLFQTDRSTEHSSVSRCQQLHSQRRKCPIVNWIFGNLRFSDILTTIFVTWHCYRTSDLISTYPFSASRILFWKTAECPEICYEQVSYLRSMWLNCDQDHINTTKFKFQWSFNVAKD